MRDEVAAELALNKDKSKLSSEAQAVMNQGCPADYLNQNTFQHILLAGNSEIDKGLRSIKKGDKALLKGNNAVVKTMTIGGNPITVQVPNILCVTYIEINNEVFEQK
jgi:hypothetical protein